MDDAHALPNDLDECHRLLFVAFQQSSELERVLDETAASYQELKETHQATIDELNRLKRWVYGHRRERIIEAKGQRHLFEWNSSSAATSPPEFSGEEPRQEVAAHSRRRRRRELDLSKLPHYLHELDLSPAEKTCRCCGRAKDRIGQDETKILDYVPSKLEVHVHVRPKYACRYCKDGVASPPPPERPIARGIAGPGLIAQIIVAKFGDHLPLYRQEDVFTRHGLHIPRSTLCDWVQAAAELLSPLYQRQKELVLKSPVLWTDDTPVTVLMGGQEGSRKGRFWTYIGEQHPYSVYDFTESRARDGPAQFLAGFRGYLHADAYGGYDQIYLGSNNTILEVACWAHARRKFFDAQSSSPRDAHQILEWIRQLYDIEERPASCRPTRGVNSVRPKQCRCSIASAHVLRSWGSGHCPRADWARQSGTPATSGRPLPLYRGWSANDRQQCQRTHAPSSGNREKELVISRESSCGSASGRAVHDPGRRKASSH